MSYFVRGFIGDEAKWVLGVYTDALSIGNALENLRLKGCTKFEVIVQ